MPEQEDLDSIADFLDSLDGIAPPPQAAPSTPSDTASPSANSSEETGSEDDLASFLDTIPDQAPPPPAPTVTNEDEGDDPAAFMDNVGLQQEREVPDITRPWMKHHKFVRVETIAQLRSIIDEALARGRCSLDLETQGLDNRIVYDAQGKPQTVHQIVGFCISVDGETGYYAPVRHDNLDGGPNLNLPVEEAEAEIRRLCLAAQPVGTPEAIAKDPLSFKGARPQVVIYFWNGQFDQEFLYPVTGIDWWHPDGWEDGMLAYFCKWAADKSIGLKPKSAEMLRDQEDHPYTMIELKELFIRGREIRFATLAPDEPGVLKYAASDAICTYLHCEPPRPWEKARVDIMLLVKGKHAFTYRLEKQVSQVVRVMERNRARVNRERIRELLVEYQKEHEQILARIRNFASERGYHNLDPNSPKQLAEFLFGDASNCLNITPKPPTNEKSGQYKTDADTFESMVKDNPHAPPILKWIVEFRGVEKMLGTYLEGLLNNPDSNSELRFSFKQTGAGTGRFSAPAGDPEHGYSGVPIHGIPHDSQLRKPFEGREGYTVVKCDYAGQELRIAANVSGEPVWTKEFLEGSGDLHSITARAFFNKAVVSKEERGMGKCVHPGTILCLDGKLVPIRNLKISDKEEEFLGVSGQVHDGNDWRELTATFNGGVKKLVHVVTSGGILTCTEEHRFQARDGSLIRAADLQKGQPLQVVSVPELIDSPYPEKNLILWEGIPSARYTLSDDLAYFAGVFGGDGTGNASSACLTHGDPEKVDAFGACYEEWVRNLEESCARCGFTTSRKDQGSLYLGSRVLVRYFRSLGIMSKRSKLLEVPDWVLATGRRALLYYFGGLFDTDGTVGKTHGLDWTTKSFVFAGQVALALRACGLDFNTELTYNRTYHRYYARLRLTVASSWEMRHYMRHPGKVARLRAPVVQGDVKDRFLVTRVLPAGTGLCQDISVEESHLYLANGFLTHNTANFALIYGGGPAAIIRATGCDKVEASRRKAAFDKSVPTFAKWIKAQHARVKKELGVWTAFQRWLAIPDANHPDHKVQASCERYSTNYPIQGSGADIMKIVMVLLHKELHRRGWLRNGGDDSVRILLTVHDELVFEIRHDRVVEAIPIIVDIMQSPTYMATPRWKVPLIVEPLVGPNWGTGYKCERVKPGHQAGPDEVIVNGFLYGTTRKAEKDRPGDGEVEEGEGDKRKIRIVDPAWLRNVKPDPQGESAEVEPSSSAPPSNASPSSPPSSVPPPASPASSVPPPASPAAPPSSPVSSPVASGGASRPIVSMRIFRLTLSTVKQVALACNSAFDPNGSVLKLVDYTGAILIDPSLEVVVNPTQLAAELDERNLSDGRFKNE